MGHFLRYFVSYESPRFDIIDQGRTINLTDYYADNVVAEQSTQLNETLDGEDVTIDIFHILLRKNLKFHDTGRHFLVYVGDGRVVKQQNVDNQLGLGYVGPDKDCIYIGLVSSPFLDLHVNQERTRYTFSDEAFDSVHKLSIASAKDYLAEDIEQLRVKQAETALNVIRENPMFLSVASDVNSYVRDNLSLGTQKEEDIYLELSRSRRRLSREVKRDISKLNQSTGQELEERVRKITDILNAEKKGSLAEYVAHRKVILDLLDSSLSYENPEERNYLKEERVHELVIPLRSDSEELSYEDHNLWILDDRLAFYSYFKSDKPFKTFLEDSDSKKRARYCSRF